MNSFTHGPWSVMERNKDKDDPLQFAVMGGDGCVAWAVERFTVNAEANAKLIAAAPEMLQKLDDVLSLLLDLDQDHLNKREEEQVCDAIQEIEAVLAKARGQS